MWPKETEVGKMLQRGYKVMGRIPEKTEEVGAVPGSPGYTVIVTLISEGPMWGERRRIG